jgi:hypothetical protein
VNVAHVLTSTVSRGTKMPATEIKCRVCGVTTKGLIAIHDPSGRVVGFACSAACKDRDGACLKYETKTFGDD